VLAKPEGPVQFPSAAYAVRFAPPHAWLGQTVALELAALGADDKMLARAELTAKLPIGGWAHFWRRFGPLLLAALVLAALLFATVRLVRHYRTPRCKRCERPISFRLKACLFCDADSTAYLVGAFRRRSDGFGRGPLPPVVLPLVAPVTDVGTHRQSAVRFPSNGRRELFFRIYREESALGPRYRLERNRFGRRVDVRVNGHAIAGARYLASGDAIALGDTTLVFRYGGGNHAI
jgi:hypothetical protein